MLDRDEFERWRKAAAGAQRSAELQATSEQHNWACFLAEQSAQLALKLILANVDRLWAALSSQDDASEHGEAPDPEAP